MAILVDDTIAVYDDSFQPTGNVRFDPWPHMEMKKLRHELHLVIEGPDDGTAAARDCLGRAAAAGLIAAIGTAFLGVGIGATAAAWEAASAALVKCLGDQFRVHLDDRSHWISWWT